MILIWNCGSSSIKYFVYNYSLELLHQGSYTNLSISNLNEFRNTAVQAIDSIANMEIKMIAFRVVSGGRDAVDGQEIDEDLMLSIESESERILHNKAVLEVMKCSMTSFPNVPHRAYFDTAFFKNLPQIAYSYALPDKVNESLSPTRLGFHGISHKAAAESVSKYEKVISIHLGAGCSAAAILNGLPIEISMGHSTNEGLMMRTRSGDIDSMLVLEIAEKFGIDKTRSILQQESGLKGVTGTDGEMLKVLDVAGYKIEDPEYIKKSYSKHEKAKARFALDLYVYRIKKYIGQYAALMNGLDAVIFTGKIGYGSSFIREMVMRDMDYLGNVEVIAFEPNEELAIARMALKSKKL